MSKSITLQQADSIVEEERLVNIELAATLWAVSPWTVRKWITEKKITSCKLGARRVIPKSEIKRVINESIVERENK